MRRAGRRFALSAVLGAAVIVAFVACSSKAGEGEGCDLGNGNDDCDNGLVCRASYEVASKSAVCCPRPPAKPGAKACEAKVPDFKPDPSVDAAPIPPGTGGGGSGGTGGTATGGAAGSGGASGGGGAAGAGGSAGASGGSAGATVDSGTD